jgi:hypothetical protein
MHPYYPVLKLDIAGNPQEWISPQAAAGDIVSDNVAWSLGPIVATLHGGKSRFTGEQSTLDIPAIIATRGKPNFDPASHVPPLSSNRQLFMRDRHICAFCGDQFHEDDLSREHILPVSKGGKDTWMNLVTACVRCNNGRGNKSYEEAGLKLLYVPYEPNLFEDFLLRRGGKQILADQMDFLMARVPHHSRLRQ